MSNLQHCQKIKSLNQTSFPSSQSPLSKLEKSKNYRWNHKRSWAKYNPYIKNQKQAFTEERNKHKTLYFLYSLEIKAELNKKQSNQYS
jgi:hypothetical protein